MGDLGLIPGLGRYPGEGKGYPFQYSGLENSMDAIVHGVPKSEAGLSDFHFHFSFQGQLCHTENYHQGAAEPRHPGEQRGKALEYGSGRPYRQQEGWGGPSLTLPIYPTLYTQETHTPAESPDHVYCFFVHVWFFMASLVAQTIKNQPAMQETWV